MQTAVDFLFKRFCYYFPKMEKSYNPLYKQAKEMERKSMIDFGNDLIAQNDSTYIGVPNLAEQYYNETYGSKGSDEIEKSEKPINPTSSQTEISDEEIENASSRCKFNSIYFNMVDSFQLGAKWYREQLKFKQNGNK